MKTMIITGIIALGIILLMPIFFFHVHAASEPIICEGQGIGQNQEGCITVTPTLSPTPMLDCDGDTDGDTPNEDDVCLSVTPTADPSVTPSPTPSVAPTDTPSDPSGSGSSDGRNDGLGCASHDCSTRHIDVPGVPNTGRGQ